MRWLLPLAFTACTDVYDGEHTANVTTTITMESAAPQTIESTEQIEIAEGDLDSNQLWFRRGACELEMFKRGGFGLRFVAGQRCDRGDATWTLQSGGAPNERSDDLVIDFAWSIETGDRTGTADEQIRIAL